MAEVRELQLNEWKRLFELPFFEEAGKVPNPATHRCVVVEDEGKLVGCWFLFTALHAEPLWVDEEYRNRRDVAPKLWPVMEEMISKTDYDGAFITIADGDAEQIAPMAEKLNFRRVEASLWMASVKVKES